MYHSILYATDLNDEHTCLAEKAAKLAKQLQAKLYLLHVIELPASIQLAQGLGFTELVKPAKDDAITVLSLLGDSLGIPSAQQFVEIGSVKEHILQKTQELSCQLIILGKHSSLLGGTSHAVTNHAPCDVLILRT